MTTPPEDSPLVTLRDGRRVRIRPLRDDDGPLLLQAFERLGEESRYRRFLAPWDHLTAPMVEYLTSIDHDLHEALAAEDESGAIVGIARFIRTREQPQSAEVAVTVIDDWQSDGVGGVLMDRLIARAGELGVTTLTGDMLGENEPMHQLLRDFGPLEITGREAGVESFALSLSGRGRA